MPRPHAGEIPVSGFDADRVQIKTNRGGGLSFEGPSSLGEPSGPANPSGSAAAPDSPNPPAKRRGRKKRFYTETQEQLIRYIAGETAVHGGACVTKGELAKIVGRNVKTVDRLIADLRRRGVVETEMRFDESGGQVASVYRLAQGASFPGASHEAR